MKKLSFVFCVDLFIFPFFAKGKDILILKNNTSPYYIKDPERKGNYNPSLYLLPPTT
jgi:hypothetical protein